jgi:hypothetical protein
MCKRPNTKCPCGLKIIREYGRRYPSALCTPTWEKKPTSTSGRIYVVSRAVLHVIENTDVTDSLWDLNWNWHILYLEE